MMWCDEKSFANVLIFFPTISIAIVDWTISKTLLEKYGCKWPSDCLDSGSNFTAFAMHKEEISTGIL